VERIQTHHRRMLSCLLIDYVESTGTYKLRTAAALLDVVVRFWREFFSRYYPDPEKARIPLGRQSLAGRCG
jgi:hypothetical protein